MSFYFFVARNKQLDFMHTLFCRCLIGHPSNKTKTQIEPDMMGLNFNAARSAEDIGQKTCRTHWAIPIPALAVGTHLECISSGKEVSGGCCGGGMESAP